MSLQSQINSILGKVFDNPDSHAKRIDKLERWQIKVMVYFSVAIFVITGIATWLIYWILNSFADRILNSI